MILASQKKHVNEAAERSFCHHQGFIKSLHQIYAMYTIGVYCQERYYALDLCQWYRYCHGLEGILGPRIQGTPPAIAVTGAYIRCNPGVIDVGNGLDLWPQARVDTLNRADMITKADAKTKYEG